MVDSSAWLEYFADGPNAAFFAPAIEKRSELIVPTIVLFEVYKRASQLRSERAALEAVAVLRHGRNATIWTQDSDFQKIAGVKFRARKT